MANLVRSCPKCKTRARIRNSWRRKLSGDTQHVLECTNPDCNHRWRERSASAYGRRCKVTGRQEA